jgi:sulfite oxidase
MFPGQAYNDEHVRQHSSQDSTIWVSYRNGVYDVTDYVSLHPGGDIILQAAG